jgi:hypothetical protein
MKTTLHIPDNYREILSLDLQKDKKKALLINALAIVIGAVLVILGRVRVPFSTLFDMEAGMLLYILRFIALILGSAVYIILHELVHGVFMKRFSGVKPNYGYTGMYAYAGSNAYFDKKSYIIIALAPVVVWGLVLAVLCEIVSTPWFWVIYIIQITNLSGAAGDFYVTWKFRSLPPDILVQDTGVSMRVYSSR